MKQYTQTTIEVREQIVPCTIYGKNADGLLRVAYELRTRNGYTDSCRALVKPEKVITRTYGDVPQAELDAQDQDWSAQHVDEVPA